MQYHAITLENIALVYNLIYYTYKKYHSHIVSCIILIYAVHL